MLERKRKILSLLINQAFNNDKQPIVLDGQMEVIISFVDITVRTTVYVKIMALIHCFYLKVSVKNWELSNITQVSNH